MNNSDSLSTSPRPHLELHLDHEVSKVRLVPDLLHLRLVIALADGFPALLHVLLLDLRGLEHHLSHPEDGLLGPELVVHRVVDGGDGRGDLGLGLGLVLQVVQDGEVEVGEVTRGRRPRCLLCVRSRSRIFC